MRNKSTITINETEIDIIELIYYDGSKLEVGEEKSIVLAWYDSYTDYEEWFFIELEKDLYQKYLSNDTTLLNILKSGNVKLIKRNFSNYDNLIIVSDKVELDKFELPDSDSYLGFNFYAEYFDKALDHEIDYSRRKRSIVSASISASIIFSRDMYAA